jgi:hypothetical protein
MQAQSPPTQAPKAAEPSNRQKKRLARSYDRGASKKNRLDAQAEIRKKYGLNNTAASFYLVESLFPARDKPRLPKAARDEVAKRTLVRVEH